MTDIDTEAIDISGMDKAEILAALFNNANPVGMGWLQAERQGNHDMDIDEAKALIGRDRLADNDYGFNARPEADGKVYTFDYIRGRPMKINLAGDQFNPRGYDQNNGGPGTAARIIDGLR